MSLARQIAFVAREGAGELTLPNIQARKRSVVRVMNPKQHVALVQQGSLDWGDFQVDILVEVERFSKPFMAPVEATLAGPATQS